MRRTLAAMLALALLLCSCGAAEAGPAAPVPAGPSLPQTSSSDTAPIRTVRIPYDPSDSLDPFTCTTLQNYYAAGLLYDTLVALDGMGAPQNRLAQEVNLQGAVCIVRLRTDGYFSDGSPVTAQDVAYSATIARRCPRYAAQLAGMLEVTTPDRYTAVFTLSAPDQYFPRSLAFPIVKEGTAGELRVEGAEENARVVVVPREDGGLPVGSGRFLLEADGATMTRNSRYHTPVKNLRTVQLVDAGTLPQQSAAVKSGELDLMYSELRGAADLSQGNQRRQVMLDDLVFLGLNSQRLGLEAPLRAAFSALIDREAVARRAYLGYAAAAWSPIKQSYSPSATGEEDPAPDPQEALLDSMGFQQRDEEGWRTWQGRRMAYRLLVNSDSSQREAAAGIIASSFEAAGIQVTVESLPFAQYSQRIAAGDYDFYLGELRVPPNLDLSSLIAPHPAIGPGCARDEELLDLYRRVKAGEEELSALDSAFRRSVPVIPLVYRRGIVALSPDFSANIVATEQDIFYNIGDW